MRVVLIQCYSIDVGESGDDTTRAGAQLEYQLRMIQVSRSSHLVKSSLQSSPPVTRGRSSDSTVNPTACPLLNTGQPPSKLFRILHLTPCSQHYSPPIPVLRLYQISMPSLSDMRIIRRILNEWIDSSWRFLVRSQGVFTAEYHGSMMEFSPSFCCKEVIPIPSFDDMWALCAVVDEVGLAK
jgi:hypothetical protein